MSLLSEKKVLRKILSTINLPILKKMVRKKGAKLNKSSEIIKYLINLPIPKDELTKTIKKEMK